MNALDRLIEERDRREPGFAAAVEAELAEIRAFDDVVNVVLDRLSELGWTREELAARADLNAASLRRLLASSSANPTFADPPVGGFRHRGSVRLSVDIGLESPSSITSAGPSGWLRSSRQSNRWSCPPCRQRTS